MRGDGDTMSAPPCVCSTPGFCVRYQRYMVGGAHAICQGGANVAAVRENYLAQQERNAKRLRSGKRDPGREIPCIHLGEQTGELRECQTCQGNTRLRVSGCALHGETTLRHCRQRCADYHAEPELIDGAGEGHHEADHYALSFAKGATMSLHTADGDADRSFAGHLSGKTAFFLGGGPSLAQVDPSRLEGRMTVAVNHVTEVFPSPSIWLATDNPETFPSAPWESSSTLKLIPRAWASCELPDGTPMRDCPSVRFFLRNTRFSPRSFLPERTVNWGSEEPWGSGRSVMLAALKLLFYFGVRRIVLVGCDFHMEPSRPYAHSATKAAAACALNNDKFAALDRRFRVLRPFLEKAGMTVVNATLGGRLDAFDRTDLEQELGR